MLEVLRSTPRTEPIVIQTDSAYVVGIFTEWLQGWRKNGMRTASKKPVENADLIDEIAAELISREVRFEKVPGHAGHVLNEQADKLARTAAESSAGH